jgi:myo-inositol 2-dehydrogenase / D-chiro-inositol 1-dehydrogenase
MPYTPKVTASLPRRRFLVQAGLGLAASAPLSRALAQTTAGSPRIRLGLAGCGGRGRWLADLFIAHGGYEISALADYFPDRLNEVATRAPVPPERRFTGLACAERMVAAGGLDAVAIITPPYFHPAQVGAAVAAGLHVYLAKPVAVDVPGCQAVSHAAATARARGLSVLVDFQTRSDPRYIEAVRRVHAGALGDLCFGEAAYHAERLVPKGPAEGAAGRLRNWVFDQALSGDIIVEQNIHTLDVMSWLMRDSPPLRCSGTGGRRARVDVGDAWDHYALAYEYPGRIGFTFSSRQFDTAGEPDGITNRLFGSRGVFSGKYGGPVMIRAKGDAFFRGGTTGGIYKEGAVANIAAFHEAIRLGDTRNPTVEPSVTSNLVAIMGRMAAQEGRTVTWSEVLASTRTLTADLAGLDA